MTKSAPFLPEDIIFYILLWLPAEVLYNVMRYVCREWYNLISDPGFINAHLQRSTDGLYLRMSAIRDSMCELEEHKCNISQPQVVGHKLTPCVLDGCDGLLFSVCLDCKQVLYIGNPITKKIWTLPQLSSRTWRISCASLTYVASIGRYKAMFIRPDENSKSEDACLILTVGIDKAWRRIDTKHLPNFRQFAFICRVVSTGGYTYLTRDDASHFFALDVEAEVFHQFLVPNVYHQAISGHYIAWRNFIALVAHCGGFVWELWALTDLSRGEWTRLYNIDLSGQRCMIEQFVPYGEPSLHCYLLKNNLSLDRCLVPVASFEKGELVILRGSF